jgi:DNA-binding transcriptional LysR family regulator
LSPTTAAFVPVARFNPRISTPPGLQLRHLHTFLTIVEVGTLTAAADRLFKTQGAVSHDLKSLEQIVGVRLMDRHRHRIELTSEGSALLPLAEGLLARARAAEAEMREVRLGRRLVLRVGVLPSLGRRMGSVVHRFRREEGDVSVRVVTAQSERLTDLLVAGRLDLVVSESTIREGVDSTLLAQERFQVALPATDPVSKDQIAAADLAGRDFIGFNRELSTPRIAERFFASTGTYPETAVEATDCWQIMELVGAGIGYGLLPVSVIAGYPNVVGVDTDPYLARELVVQTRRLGPLSISAETFRGLIEADWGTVRLPA